MWNDSIQRLLSTFGSWKWFKSFFHIYYDSFQTDATEAIPGGGHRASPAGQPDHVRHRMAVSVVHRHQAEFWARFHPEGPRRSARSRSDQNHGN